MQIDMQQMTCLFYAFSYFDNCLKINPVISMTYISFLGLVKLLLLSILNGWFEVLILNLFHASKRLLLKLWCSILRVNSRCN